MAPYPPLPPSALPRPSALPPPLPAHLTYRTARVEETAWVTIATLRSSAQWHSARAMLSQYQIISRVGPSLDDSEEIDLQVPPTEAEWAREILKPGLQRIAGIATPPGGFPVQGIAAQPAVERSVTSPPAPGLRPLAVAPLSLPAARPAGGGYYVVLTILWIAAIVITLWVVLACTGVFAVLSS